MARLVGWDGLRWVDVGGKAWRWEHSRAVHTLQSCPQGVGTPGSVPLMLCHEPHPLLEWEMTAWSGLDEWGDPYHVPVPPREAPLGVVVSLFGVEEDKELPVALVAPSCAGWHGTGPGLLLLGLNSPRARGSRHTWKRFRRGQGGGRGDPDCKQLPRHWLGVGSCPLSPPSCIRADPPDLPPSPSWMGRPAEGCVVEHPPTHGWVPGAASIPLSCRRELSVPFFVLFSILTAQDRPQEASPGPGRRRKGGAGSCPNPNPNPALLQVLSAGFCNLFPAGKPFSLCVAGHRPSFWAKFALKRSQILPLHPGFSCFHGAL